MRRTIIVTLLGLALALAALPAAGAAAPERAPLHRAGGEAVEGSYIVVLEDGRDAAAVAAQVGARPEHVYEAALRGFAARLDARALERVRRHPHVAFVEEDQVVTVADQLNPPWGLDRIDQRNLPLDGWYRFTSGGSGAHVYIADTGIDYTHTDFSSRVWFGYDAFGGNGSDCNGHGTHVAGTAAGSTYGVAKQATLWSVRVLDCNGYGSWAGVIAGTDWIAANHQSPAVANYSLVGGYSAAMNGAVDNLFGAGVFVAVAAGNSSADACNYSPASAANAYAVAASDSADGRAWFSNYGPCVNIYAPGVAITSAKLGGGSTVMNGTSMASPHVAGVAALLRSILPVYGPGFTRNWLTGNATTGVISGNPSGTPNRLLFKHDL